MLLLDAPKKGIANAAARAKDRAVDLDTKAVTPETLTELLGLPGMRVEGFAVEEYLLPTKAAIPPEDARHSTASTRPTPREAGACAAARAPAMKASGGASCFGHPRFGSSSRHDRVIAGSAPRPAGWPARGGDPPLPA